MAYDRHLQFRRNLETLYSDFAEAKTSLETYVEEHGDELKDGEVLIVRYGEAFSSATSSVGVVVKKDDNVSISFDLQNAIDYTDKAIEGLTPGGSTEITSSDSSINVTDKTKVAVNKDGQTLKQKDTKELFVADAVIENGFKVLGTNVGELTSGTQIADGTTVIELLKKMLVKEADCTTVLPYVSLSLSTTGVCEVGTEVEQTLTSTYHDGKFKYDATNYGTATDQYLDAGCTEGTTTYKRDTTTLDSNVDTLTMEEGRTTWSSSTAYGASTGTPKKNNGEDSTQSISASETVASSKTLTGHYKHYYGATTAETVDDVTVDGLTTGWTNVNVKTVVVDDKTSYTLPSGGYFVIMCASKYKLASIEDASFGTDLLPNFTVVGTKEIAIGGTSTATYNVYIWKKTPSSTPETKNITLTKA